MKLSVQFSGMICLVRKWPARSNPDQPSEARRHRVVMVGAYGDGVTGVPRHEPHMVVPADALAADSTWTPDRIVETPAGQMAVFDIAGNALRFVTGAAAGVEFRDRLRPPSSGSPKADPEADAWEDIVWLPDYKRVLDAQPVWRVDPATPGRGDIAISFTAALNDGALRPVEPKSARDRRSTWAFEPQLDAQFVQPFTDAVRWRVAAAAPMLQATAFGTTEAKGIAFRKDCQVLVSALSRELPGAEDPDRLVHFKGFASLFANADAMPTPVRRAAADVGRGAEGEAAVEPLFCMMAAVNEFE